MAFIIDSLSVDTISTLKSLTSSTTPKRVNNLFLTVLDTGNSTTSWYLYKLSATDTESLPSIVSPTDSIGRWFQYGGTNQSSGGSGTAGTVATISVGTVTALNPSQVPTVVNAGTTSAATLNFGIPSSPTFAVGTVTGLSAGTTPTITNVGSNGNVTLNFGIPAGASGAVGTNGTNGTNGTSGTSAFTTTTVSFTQPVISSTVSVSVANTSWMVAGQILFVATAGFYQVSSITNSTTVVLNNLGYPGSAIATTVITSPQGITPGGLIGATGATGSVSSVSSLAFNYAAIPTTSTSQLGLYADNADGLLKVRTQSNGTAYKVAYLDLPQQYNGTQGSTNSTIIYSATPIVDLSLSNVYTLNLTGNVTTFDANNLRVATYIFLLIQDATGSRTISFASKFKFSGGTAPTLTTTATKTDIVSCICDGTSLYCTFVGNY